MNLISADMLMDDSVSTSIVEGTTSATVNFVLNHTGVGGNYTISWYGQSTQGNWTLPILSQLNTGELHSLSATLNNIPSNFVGTITGNITVNDTSGSSTETMDVVINVTASPYDDYCTLINNNDIEVKIKGFENSGIGSDDNWYPLDSIEVEVEIENSDNNDNLENVLVEWALVKNGEFIVDWTEIDEFDLDADEKETLTFTIDLDEEVDIDELSNGKYELYVRVNADAVDVSGEPQICTSDMDNVDIVIERNYVVLQDIAFEGTSYCGNTIQLIADVWNLGSRDQEDVYVKIMNSDLGIDEKIEIGDIDSMDDDSFELQFTIPKDAEEKTYSIVLEVYDDSDDIYESEDKSRYTMELEVSGNCEKISKATVYASLESGGKAGQEMKILATVTNTGEELGTFTVSAADYANWAELVSITPSIVTLNADESKDVMITLKVDKDVSDEQSFNILLEKDGEEALTQPVSVVVEKGFSLSGIFGDNGYIWGIALINIILVVIIITVAVKATRR